MEFGGTGAVRQPVIGGAGFWLPVVWDGYVVPAQEFVWVAQVKPLGLPLMRAGDEFKDGKGRMRVGRRFFDGDGYDRAEYTVLWCWTLLLAPQEAQARPDVVIEAAGADAARVTFPFRNETWECTLRFATDDGLLRTLETHRFDPKSAAAETLVGRGGALARLGRGADSRGRADPLGERARGPDRDRSRRGRERPLGRLLRCLVPSAKGSIRRAPRRPPIPHPGVRPPQPRYCLQRPSDDSEPRRLIGGRGTTIRSPAQEGMVAMNRWSNRRRWDR